MKEKSFEPGRDNIVLIGMPGVGKSTLGIVLAKILCMDFVDADLLIQQSCDKSLQRLIDTLGPDAFLEIENQVLSEMSFEHSVIATGGSLHALETLAAKSTGTVVGCCAALAEGDAAKRTDIFFLEPLPLFAH